MTSEDVIKESLQAFKRIQQTPYHGPLAIITLEADKKQKLFLTARIPEYFPLGNIPAVKRAILKEAIVKLDREVAKVGD